MVYFRYLFIITVCCNLLNNKVAAQSGSSIIKQDTCAYHKLGIVSGNTLLIDKVVDLDGGICEMPQNMTIRFNDGMINNGTIIGNNTKVETQKTVFNHVTIKGSWDVPEISTKLFADLKGENALRNVMALANPKVHNRIVIEKGMYKVAAKEKDATCLSVCSNTELIINGTIQLKSNDLKSCDIIIAKGKNIKITGKGTIIGDKHTHTGKGGEWGMGIRFHKAINAIASGLTIKDCWGDCIYVGGNSRNVLIENCVLDHGRRQGISITKADGVTIRNCIITNVSGTNPQYAIDVEPNRRDSVDNILIEKVTVKNCEGGFLATRGKPKDGAKTPWIGRVAIRNCQVASKSKRPVSIKRCEEVRIEECSLYANNGRTAISVTETGMAVVQSNMASIDGSIMEMAKNGAKKIMGKAVEPVHVQTKRESTVRNNKIIER